MQQYTSCGLYSKYSLVSTFYHMLDIKGRLGRLLVEESPGLRTLHHTQEHWSVMNEKYNSSFPWKHKLRPPLPVISIMNITEVQNPRRKLNDKCLRLPYVFAVLAWMCNQVCSCASEALLLTLQALSLSFLTNINNNSSSDRKALLRSQQSSL